jgi:hypothetical protein
MVSNTSNHHRYASPERLPLASAAARDTALPPHDDDDDDVMY